MQWKNKTIALILRPSTNKAFKLECINQIGKVAKTSHSYLIQVSHTILKDFLWSSKWNSALLLAKILKSLRETTQSQRSMAFHL